MTFHFRVQLSDITNPPVWRLICIPNNRTFLAFHQAIQNAFGWEDEHLFQFMDKEYNSNILISILCGSESPDLKKKIKEASKVKLAQVFQKVGHRLMYEYDFGDGWIHEITLEAISDDDDKGIVCLSGEGACPPEDCGGIGGYENIKETFKKSPKSEEAQEYRDWLGLEDKENWDAQAFDIKVANARLKNIR